MLNDEEIKRISNRCFKCGKNMSLANGGFFAAVDENKIMCLECYNIIMR